MTRQDRAAQFSPFAALTGYEAVIAESGRLTDAKTELTDSSVEEINEKLQRLTKNDAVTVTYFVPDKNKSGGRYVTVTGFFKRVDTCEQVLLLADGSAICLDAICSLQ